MSETKWTPGPWVPYESSERNPLPAGISVEVGTRAGCGAKTGTVCEMVAQGNGRYEPEVTEANARLIAAAPEMYEACAQAKKYLEPDLVEPGRTVFWNLVAALRKARGEA